MRTDQRGMSLSGLLMASVVVAMLAVLSMKIIPEYMEYYRIVKVIKKIAAASDAASTVPQIKIAYEKQANIDYISAVASSDLGITKEGGKVLITFSYERRVHLAANVSLLLDFSGSSR